MKKADLIICSDLHLREDNPICRTDDFQTAQWTKIETIRFLQEKHDCPVICAGDVFHHWKPSPSLISKAIGNLPNRFFTVAGQHDLPQHNYNLIHKSGLWTLFAARTINLLPRGFYGDNEPSHLPLTYRNSLNGIGVWHRLTWHEDLPYPDCKENNAIKLLKEFVDFKLLITGDNHNAFIADYRDRLLVNPGCMTRQKASEADYIPRVYLYYEHENYVDAVYLPSKEGVVSREHIDKVTERDERIAAFVTRLSSEWDTSISFEENMDKFERENMVRKSVMDVIRKAMEKRL